MGDGYHSLRIMSSKGPNFNHNLVRDDGTIWPIGDVNDYPAPKYRYRNQEVSMISEIESLKKKEEKKGQEKKQKQQKGKKTAANKKNKKKDSCMIDTSTKTKKNESDDEEMDENS